MKWMQTLIRVSEIQEQGYKQQCGELNREIATKQREMTKAATTLGEYKSRMGQMEGTACAPRLLQQTLHYIHQIENNLRDCKRQVRSLHDKKLQVQEELKQSAQQRILIEGIEQRYQQQEQILCTNREESLMAELSNQLLRGTV